MRRRILGLISILWGAGILFVPYIPDEWNRSRHRGSPLLENSIVSFLVSAFGVLLLVVGLRILIKSKKG